MIKVYLYAQIYIDFKLVIYDYSKFYIENILKHLYKMFMNLC
jgi:hypothetical protein